MIRSEFDPESFLCSSNRQVQSIKLLRRSKLDQAILWMHRLMFEGGGGGRGYVEAIFFLTGQCIFFTVKAVLRKYFFPNLPPPPPPSKVKWSAP